MDRGDARLGRARDRARGVACAGGPQDRARAAGSRLARDRRRSRGADGRTAGDDVSTRPPWRRRDRQHRRPSAPPAHRARRGDVGDGSRPRPGPLPDHGPARPRRHRRDRRTPDDVPPAVPPHRRSEAGRPDHPPDAVRDLRLRRLRPSHRRRRRLVDPPAALVRARATRCTRRRTASSSSHGWSRRRPRARDRPPSPRSPGTRAAPRRTSRCASRSPCSRGTTGRRRPSRTGLRARLPWRGSRPPCRLRPRQTRPRRS